LVRRRSPDLSLAPLLLLPGSKQLLPHEPTLDTLTEAKHFGVGMMIDFSLNSFVLGTLGAIQLGNIAQQPAGQNRLLE
jgi:hypothetical protein